MQLNAIQYTRPLHTPRFGVETFVIPGKNVAIEAGTDSLETNTAKKKAAGGALSKGRNFPYSHFFVIGGFITAGSMAMRGLIEGAIPWVWSYFTGL